MSCGLFIQLCTARQNLVLMFTTGDINVAIWFRRLHYFFDKFQLLVNMAHNNISDKNTSSFNTLLCLHRPFFPDQIEFI